MKPKPTRPAVDPAQSWVGGDSQQSLARDIAKEALAGLPEVTSRAEVEAAVDRAVRHESRRMERLLAQIRVVALTLGLAFLAARMVWAAPTPGGTTLFALLSAWWLASGALLVAVFRNGYRSWMRLIVPAADALLFALVFTLLAREPEPADGALAAAAGALAFLLALLGPIRLSRSAHVVSTVGAVGLGMLAAVEGSVGAAAIAAVIAVILGVSFVGSRLTGGVRRVIAHEVRGSRLTRLLESAQEALDAREQMLGIVCHDLRTPLTTIVATAGLLLEIPVAEDARAGHLQAVKRAGEHMNRLIHDLLDVSRIEAGKLAVSPVPYAVSDLMRTAEQLLRPATDLAGVALVVRSAPAEETVLADPERVMQVLYNLVGNAVKFSPAGGTIVIEARTMGSKVRISVTDQGPGIPEHELEHLWKRLWQAQPGDQRGLGLGLTIAKSIVEAHGERIGVESEREVGSEFWFTLARTGGLAAD